MGGFLLGVVRRDLTIAARRRGDWLTAVFFFVLVSSLFPLGVGPEPQLLQRIGPGVLWVAATLASLLSLSRLFEDDHRDGSLDQMLLSPSPVVLLVLGKVLAHWLVYGLPLLLIAPLLGLQFNLPAEAIGVLVFSLLLGTPILSLLGAAGAIEAIFSILAVRDGVAPPTLNLDEPSTASVIDRVAHHAQERRIDVALSNSFGFGGTNASILFKKAA